MAIRLARCLGPVYHLQPKEYTVETASGAPAICCPGCGCISELPHTHEINASGNVSMAWSCPSPSCPFWDWLTLEAWGEQVVPA